MIVAMMMSGVVMAGARTDLATRAKTAQAYAERLAQVLVVGGLPEGYTVRGDNTQQEREAAWQDYTRVRSYGCRPSEQLREAQSIVRNPVACDRMFKEWKYWNESAADLWQMHSDLEINSGGI